MFVFAIDMGNMGSYVREMQNYCQTQLLNLFSFVLKR